MPHHTSPSITIGAVEHDRLALLAMTGTGHGAAASDGLLYELDRARVVPEAELPPGVVRMGSTVTYATDDGRRHMVRLAYPAEADGAPGRLSVLSPVGTALLGVAAGQPAAWIEPNGRKRGLDVLAVSPPRAT